MTARTRSRTKSCPICRKPHIAEFSPFCSRGCRDRDLNQWFNDGYSVPGRPVSPDEIASKDTFEEG